MFGLLQCPVARKASQSNPHQGGRARRRAAVLATLMSDVPAKVVTRKDASAVAERQPAKHALNQMGINLDEHVPVVHKRSRKAKPVTVAMLNDVRTMFTSLLHEYAYWVDESWVTGTIPPELYGTYYRNGPALHVTNPRYRRHILDGDGMVFSIAFKDGKAYFRNRFVRTKGFLEEQAAGHPLYRNSFTRGSHDGSTPWFNPLDLTFKNVANTGVLPWGGQLYALWEAGLPYLMDPTSLATHRESRMGGQIRANTFAAHYRIVTEGATSCSPSSAAAVGAKATASNANANASQQPQQRHMEHGAASMSAAAAAAGHAYSGSSDNTCSSSSCRRLVTFSNEFSYGGATAVFYEFDEAGQLLHETRHRLQGLDIALIHDMVVTEHYYVLVVGSIHLDPFKFLTQYALGLCSIAEVMVFDPRQPTRIMMFPRPARPSGKVLAPRVLTTEPLFVFHNVNGWEEEEEEEEGGEGAPAGGMKVVLDCVAWDEVSFDMGLFDKYKQRVDGFVGGARTQLTRLTCDLRTGAVECRKLLQRTVEFPMTDPRVTARRHSVAWFIADAVDHPVLWGPAQSVIRVEVEPDTAPRTAAATTGGEGGGRPAAAAVEPRQLAPPRPAAGTVRGLAAGAAPGLAVDCWYLGDRTFPGEPMFIPRPGSSREGDGWLLVAVHNADSQRADVLIFDAEALSAGPLATLHLPHRLPVSLHGAWDPTYRGPDPHDPKVPRWQEPSVVRPM